MTALIDFPSSLEAMRYEEAVLTLFQLIPSLDVCQLNDTPVFN